ncbi:unnamed protein product [Pedinophyceae sp. YPF-701]|nr:unnamed protein product [Pedinophyceae sp. YPF-701]
MERVPLLVGGKVYFVFDGDSTVKGADPFLKKACGSDGEDTKDKPDLGQPMTQADWNSPDRDRTDRRSRREINSLPLLKKEVFHQFSLHTGRTNTAQFQGYGDADVQCCKFAKEEADAGRVKLWTVSRDSDFLWFETPHVQVDEGLTRCVLHSEKPDFGRLQAASCIFGNDYYFVPYQGTRKRNHLGFKLGGGPKEGVPALKEFLLRVRPEAAATSDFAGSMELWLKIVSDSAENTAGARCFCGRTLENCSHCMTAILKARSLVQHRNEGRCSIANPFDLDQSASRQPEQIVRDVLDAWNNEGLLAVFDAGAAGTALPEAASASAKTRFAEAFVRCKFSNRCLQPLRGYTWLPTVVDISRGPGLVDEQEKEDAELLLHDMFGSCHAAVLRDGAVPWSGISMNRETHTVARAAATEIYAEDLNGVLYLACWPIRRRLFEALSSGSGRDTYEHADEYGGCFLVYRHSMSASVLEKRVEEIKNAKAAALVAAAWHEPSEEDTRPTQTESAGPSPMPSTPSTASHDRTGGPAKTSQPQSRATSVAEDPGATRTWTAERLKFLGAIMLNGDSTYQSWLELVEEAERVNKCSNAVMLKLLLAAAAKDVAASSVFGDTSDAIQTATAAYVDGLFQDIENVSDELRYTLARLLPKTWHHGIPARGSDVVEFRAAAIVHLTVYHMLLCGPLCGVLPLVEFAPVLPVAAYPRASPGLKAPTWEAGAGGGGTVAKLAPRFDELKFSDP